MENITKLVADLEARMAKDVSRMHVYRNVHRTMGFLITAVLLFLPAALAVGYISAATPGGRVAIFVIAVASGYNAAFNPLVHSSRRRRDMNDGRRLLDALRCDVFVCHDDETRLSKLYKTYSDRFARMYAERGKDLVDADVAKQLPSREKAELVT